MLQEEELYQLFCGVNQLGPSIEAIRVIRDPSTSLGKGIAYVLFKTRVRFMFLPWIYNFIKSNGPAQFEWVSVKLDLVKGVLNAIKSGPHKVLTLAFHSKGLFLGNPILLQKF